MPIYSGDWLSVYYVGGPTNPGSLELNAGDSANMGSFNLQNEGAVQVGVAATSNDWTSSSGTFTISPAETPLGSAGVEKEMGLSQETYTWTDTGVPGAVSACTGT